MTLFEYLMVLVSIIVGLGMTQALRGLSKIARSGSRYLPVTLWVCTLLYYHLQVWWGLWDNNVVETWNQAYFALIVLIPCFLFGATELLVPMGATADTDWKAHYFSVRRWFFAMLIVFICLAILDSRILLGVPLTHPYRVVQVLALGLMVVGWLSDRPRLQAWIPISNLAVILVGQALFRLFPGLT